MIENNIKYINWILYDNVGATIYLVKRFAIQYFSNYDALNDGVKFYGGLNNTSFIHVIASKITKKLSQVKMQMTREDFIALDKTIFDGFDQLDPNRQIDIKLVHGVENYTILNLNVVSSTPLEDTSMLTYQAMTDLAQTIYQFPSFLYIEIVVTFTC